MMPKLSRALWLLFRLLTSAVIEPNSASLASDSNVHTQLFVLGPNGLECELIMTDQITLIQTNQTGPS